MWTSRSGAISKGMHSVTPHVVVRRRRSGSGVVPIRPGCGGTRTARAARRKAALRGAVVRRLGGEESPTSSLKPGCYPRRAWGARRSSSICSRTTSPRSGSGPSMRAPRSSIRSRISSGATNRGSSPIPSATDGTWPSTCVTFHARRSLGPLPRHSAVREGTPARAAHGHRSSAAPRCRSRRDGDRGAKARDASGPPRAGRRRRRRCRRGGRSGARPLDRRR